MTPTAKQSLIRRLLVIERKNDANIIDAQELKESLDSTLGDTMGDSRGGRYDDAE